MEELERRVERLARQSIHGTCVDDTSNVDVTQLIGVVDIGETATSADERGTILDPTKEFWSDWPSTVSTTVATRAIVTTAVQSLRERGVIRFEEQDDGSVVILVEPSEIAHTTSCADCGGVARVTIEPVLVGNNYSLQLRADCCECSFSGVFEKTFVRA